MSSPIFHGMGRDHCLRKGHRVCSLESEGHGKDDSYGLEAVGTVFYVGPLVGEDTRTTKARIAIPNADGKMASRTVRQSGTFAAQCFTPLVVRNEAIQTFQNRPVVFVQYDDQYEACPVTVGRSNDKFSEILKGLSQESVT